MDRVRPRTNWRPAACDQHQDLALGLGGLPGIERCLDRLLDLGRCTWAFASTSGVHHHVAHRSEQVVQIWECAQFLSIALSGRYSGRCAFSGPGFLTVAGDNWAAIGHIRSTYSESKAPGFLIQYRHLDGPLRDCDGNRLLRPSRILPGNRQLDAWSRHSGEQLEDPDPTRRRHPPSRSCRPEAVGRTRTRAPLPSAKSRGAASGGGGVHPCLFAM
jgi:hypothetical protein